MARTAAAHTQTALRPPTQTAPKRDARICRTAAAAADYCIRTFMCVLRGSNKDGKAEA